MAKGFGLTVKLAGDRELMRELRKAAADAPHILGAGVYALASTVATRSKRNAPKDIGTLRASGYATLPRVTGKKVVCDVGHGGPAADYAVPQHERMDYNHTEGGAKYLQRAVESVAASGMKLVARYALIAMQTGAKTPSPFPGLPTNPNDAGPSPRKPKGKTAGGGAAKKRRGRR
jgi:hypothetical protein